MCMSQGTANWIDPIGSLETSIAPKPLQPISGLGGTLEWYDKKTKTPEPNAPSPTNMDTPVPAAPTALSGVQPQQQTGPTSSFKAALSDDGTDINAASPAGKTALGA